MRESKKLTNKTEIVQLIQLNKDRISSLGAKRIGLFGSFVSGNPHSESDIDILVEFSPGAKNFRNYTDLYFLLTELLGRRIDFLTPESLSPYIGPHILKQVEYVPFGD